ncbi:MAG TPA: zf-HC2 domain-containing protein [Solirubrobacteraceae bacterium]|nr:zf-HC2 domain-containing protein [Solirubrobacteraceae bacterium]
MNGGPIKRWMFMRQHQWTAARLSDYLDDELSQRDRERVERHTGICPECSRVLATLRRTVRELMGLHEEPLPSVADGVIERLRRSW